MKQTQNYQLNQWEKTDRIEMEDFNADNARVDAALAEEKAARESLTAQVAKCGNCDLVVGTYTGTGQVGASHPNKLTFSGKPILVIIQTQRRYGYNCDRMVLLRNADWAYGLERNEANCPVTWGDRSVSWYHASAAAEQMNLQDYVFCYAAFLAKE